MLILSLIDVQYSQNAFFAVPPPSEISEFPPVWGFTLPPPLHPTPYHYLENPGAGGKASFLLNLHNSITLRLALLLKTFEGLPFFRQTILFFKFSKVLYVK